VKPNQNTKQQKQQQTIHDSKIEGKNKSKENRSMR